MPVNDLQEHGPTSGWLQGPLGAFPMKALTLGIAATLVFLTLISLEHETRKIGRAHV